MFILAATERLAAAAALYDELRASASPAPGWLVFAWPFLVLAGAAAAWMVGNVLYDTVEARRRVRVGDLRDAATARGGDPTKVDDHRADAAALRFFSRAAVVAWALWQALAFAQYHDVAASWGPVRALLHLAAVGFALVAVGGAGRAIGDVRIGWDRTSLVRVQLVVLVVLGAAFFVVGVTTDQVADVLRAWGDPGQGGERGWSRVTYGIAAAVLLGALLRASAQRLLFPQPWSDVRTRWISVVAGVALPLLAIVAYVVADAWIGAIALLVVALAIASPLPWSWAPAREPVGGKDEQALERLPGTLGIAPMAILFAALSGALLDSLLLDSPDAPVGLIGATLGAGAVLAVLVRFAHVPHVAGAEAARRHPGWEALGVFVVAGALAGLAGAGGDAAAVASPLLAAGMLAVACGYLHEWGTTEFAAAAGVVVGTVFAVYVDPVGAPRAYGAIGVSLAGLAGVLLLLYVAAVIGARRALHPRLCRPFLPDRLPILGLLTVWAAVAWVAAPDTLHQARTVAKQPGAEPQSLEARVHAWLDARTAGGETHVPMVLLAASGGGAKAAYWTDLVLDCLAADSPPDRSTEDCAPADSDTAERRLGHVFLTSSVSGGSAGIYRFARNRPKIASGEPWIETTSREVLSPIVAWGLFHDLPAYMLGAHTDPRHCLPPAPGDADDRELVCLWHADRAVAQEAALTGSDGDIVPRDDAAVLDGEERPVMVFNASRDGANDRVLISPVILTPPSARGCSEPWEGQPVAAGTDGHDLLRPGQDVPLVTAALLTARFPVVAPSARLGDSEPRGRVCREPRRWAKLRDGGYVENSGLLTIVELLPAIQASIRSWNGPADPDVPIVVVSVDDDPVVACGATAGDEEPPTALGIGSRAGPRFLTRFARDRLTSGALRGVQYVRISPPPHLGAHAATGWELSRTARREDLVAALARAAPEEAGDPTREVDAGVELQRLRDAVDGEPVRFGCGGGR